MFNLNPNVMKTTVNRIKEKRDAMKARVMMTFVLVFIATLTILAACVGSGV